jgi:hypothetical protein
MVVGLFDSSSMGGRSPLTSSSRWLVEPVDVVQGRGLDLLACGPRPLLATSIREAGDRRLVPGWSRGRTRGP